MIYRNVCGPKVRQVREAKGWSRKKLADELMPASEIFRTEKMTGQLIARIETRHRMVLDDEISLLATVLGTSINELVPSLEEVKAEKKRLQQV